MWLEGVYEEGTARGRAFPLWHHVLGMCSFAPRPPAHTTLRDGVHSGDRGGGGEANERGDKQGWRQPWISCPSMGGSDLDGAGDVVVDGSVLWKEVDVFS